MIPLEHPSNKCALAVWAREYYADGGAEYRRITAISDENKTYGEMLKYHMMSHNLRTGLIRTEGSK